MSDVAFRGSVVRSRADRGPGTHRLVVSPRAVSAHLFLSAPVRLSRDDVVRVTVEPIFPGVWQRVTFHTADATLMFEPFRPRRLVATLRAYGWPVA